MPSAGPKKAAQPSLDAEFLKRLRAVTAKRPKTVIDHILAHGFITTEELTEKYGYDHPPRAARDVREQGIPLETFKMKSSSGRAIAAYRFGDLTQVLGGKLGGRKVAPKAFKDQLIESQGSRCAVCRTPYEGRYLQVDHRVPYEVEGEADSGDWLEEKFMLLCGSCNRSKSWSCEGCKNWNELKEPASCRTCYWASPESYEHIALQQSRRLDIVWSKEEIAAFEALRRDAQTTGVSVADLVKKRASGRP